MKNIHLISLFIVVGAMFRASVATATVSVTTVSNSSTVAPGTSVFLMAFCPPGSKPVGGGWLVNEDVTKVVRSRVAAAFNGWQLAASNFGTWTDQVSVYVRCASGLPSGAVVSETRRLSPISAYTSMSLSVYPPCPSGSIQTAIGFDAGLWVEAGTLSLNGAVFRNPSAAGRVEIDGVCLSNAGSTAFVKEYESTTFVDRGNGYGMSGVSCPSGTVATGGSYNGDWSGNLFDVPYYASSDSAYPNGWTIYTDFWYHTAMSARARVFCATIP